MALRYKNALSNARNCISANSRGSVLLLAVLALMVVFTLGTGLLAVATSNYVMNQAEHDYQAAFYAAEAGLHHKIEVMRAEMDRLYLEGSYTNASAFFNTFWERIKDKKALSLDIDMINDKPVKAQVTTSKGTLGNDFCEYKIQSIGIVGRIRRTIESTVRVKYAPKAGAAPTLSTLFSYAIFVNGKINQTSNASYIEGNIGTNGTDSDVSLKNHSGNVQTNCSLALPKIVFPSIEEAGEPLVVNRDMTIAVPGSMKYSSITVDKNKTLTIQLNGGDTVIYTDTLEMNNKSNINLQGEGRLILYIRDAFVMDGSINQGGDPSKVIVFYDGEAVGGATSKFNFYGGLYAPKLNLHLSAQVDIKGSIVVKEIKIAGNGSIVFSHVYDESNPISVGGVGTDSVGPKFDIVSYQEL